MKKLSSFINESLNESTSVGLTFNDVLTELQINGFSIKKINAKSYQIKAKNAILQLDQTGKSLTLYKQGTKPSADDVIDSYEDFIDMIPELVYDYHLK